jgi:hypothetical protein
MSGSTYYPVAAVSYSFDGSLCWTDMTGLPPSDTGKKCSKPNPPCEECAGSIRILLTNEVIEYEFVCDPNANTAGYIRKNTATGQVEVVNWSSET